MSCLGWGKEAKNYVITSVNYLEMFLILRHYCQTEITFVFTLWATRKCFRIFVKEGMSYERAECLYYKKEMVNNSTKLGQHFTNCTVYLKYDRNRIIDPTNVSKKAAR